MVVTIFVGLADICFDPDWNDSMPMKRAVLRRKLRPCTAEDPCANGEGDCLNDNANCMDGLHCKLRENEEATAEGQPLHGIEFTGDLL